jgi:hypothetical protein
MNCIDPWFLEAELLTRGRSADRIHEELNVICDHIHRVGIRIYVLVRGRSIDPDPVGTERTLPVSHGPKTGLKTYHMIVPRALALKTHIRTLRSWDLNRVRLKTSMGIQTIARSIGTLRPTQTRPGISENGDT